MRNQKHLIGSMVIICLVTIIFAYITNCHRRNFLSNIFIGIFSSGLLTLFISIIGYQNEKRNALENFYMSAHKALNNFSLYENSGQVESTINKILKINEYDYSELHNAYGSIDFIFMNCLYKKYIFDSIYKKILNLKELIDSKSIDFKFYLNAQNGNKEAMKHFINDIDKEIMYREEKDIINDNGEIIHTYYAINKFIKCISAELNGKYYKIMYGKEKSI